MIMLNFPDNNLNPINEKIKKQKYKEIALKIIKFGK